MAKPDFSRSSQITSRRPVAGRLQPGVGQSLPVSVLPPIDQRDHEHAAYEEAQVECSSAVGMRSSASANEGFLALYQEKDHHAP